MGLFGFGKKKKEEVAQSVSYNSDGDFEMTVSDVFNIASRGTVVTGQITSGSVSTGDTVSFSNGISAKVEGIESNRKVVASAFAGQAVGLLVKIPANSVSKGMIVTK